MGRHEDRVTRPGGAVGRVGVPQHAALPAALPSFFKNVTIGGGPAPVRADIDELLPDVLDGRIEPVAYSTVSSISTVSRTATAR